MLIGLDKSSAFAKDQNMPPNVVKTPAQEKRWREAKKAYRKSSGKKEADFTDQDWGTVMKIYKEMGP